MHRLSGPSGHQLQCALACLLVTWSCSGPPQGAVAGRPGAPGGGPGGPPPVPVQTVTVELSSAPIEIAASGSLRSPETAGVAPDISGIVVELDAPEGRPVERGHILARIDDADSRAAVQVAEARHANAKATFERVEPLYRDGVVPRQSFDDAQAELATAEGMLAEATTRLGKNVVRAPFDGILGLRTVKAGEYVSSGDTIVQLTRIEPLELTFSVAEDDAHLLRNGQLVRGHVGRCGTSFEGRVAALDPTVDPATRTLGVLARVANERRELRPGMSARVTVEIGQREQALLIPHEALVRSGTRYLVWVVAEGVANQQEVVPASFSSTSVEIASGLEAGAEVVVAGHQKLRPGAPVVAQPWQEIDNPLLRLGEQSGDDC